jgi:hypothetical protein
MQEIRAFRVLSLILTLGGLSTSIFERQPVSLFWTGGLAHGKFIDIDILLAFGVLWVGVKSQQLWLGDRVVCIHVALQWEEGHVIC